MQHADTHAALTIWLQGYGEWDQALRRLADAKLMLEAVHCGTGGCPGKGVYEVLEYVRTLEQAAAGTGIRQQVEGREMDGRPVEGGRQLPQKQEQQQEQEEEELQQEVQPGGAASAASDAPATSSGGKAAVTAGQVAPSEEGSLVRGDSPGVEAGAAGSSRQAVTRRRSARGGAGGMSSCKRRREKEAVQGQQQQLQVAADAQPAAEQMQVDTPAPAAAAAAPAPAVADEAGPSSAAGQGAKQGGGQEVQQEGQEEGQAHKLLSELEKEALARQRAWRKMELDCLELLAHMLRQCGNSDAALREAARQAARQAGRPPRPAKRQKQTSAAGGGGAGGVSGSGGGARAGGGAEAAAAAEPPSHEMVRVQLEEAEAAVTALRQELGLGYDSTMEGVAAIRRSKRRAGIGADSEEEVLINVEGESWGERRWWCGVVCVRGREAACIPNTPCQPPQRLSSSWLLLSWCCAPQLTAHPPINPATLPPICRG